jgi:DNA-binding IclR family transcriptional regulator
VKTRHRNFTPDHRRVLNMLEFVGKPMTLDDIVLSVYTPREITFRVLEDLVVAGLAERSGANSYAAVGAKGE